MKESAYTKKALPEWQEKNPDARIYRNNTGMAWQGDYPIFFGVGKPVKDKKTGRMIQKGGGDYIGFTSKTICEIINEIKDEDIDYECWRADKHGCKNCPFKIAIFTNVEIKQKNGRESKEQKDFREIVTEAGGISVILQEGKEIE